MKLYELTYKYNEILTRDDLDDDLLKNALEDVKEEIQEKAENIAKMIRNIDGEITAFKMEADRLIGHIRTLNNKKDGAKRYLEEQLLYANIEKIKLELFTVAMQNNPPSVEILGDVPQEYMIPQPDTIDKRRILADLKAGIEVENAELKQTRSLRIR